MYFVDRDKIELTLQYIEQSIMEFENQPTWVSPIEKKALERISQMIIEAILDVGNSMIDGFIMRDPGSFEDIIDILEDERVINQKQAHELKQVLQLRKMLVREYVEVDHVQLHKTIFDHLECIKKFPSEVRTYIVNELGPVSAFRN